MFVKGYIYKSLIFGESKMKLAGIANTSVAEVKHHLKDAFVLEDKMSTKYDIILCPSYRIFKKWHY